MKFGTTWRRLLCKKCKKPLAWFMDVFIEGDTDGAVLLRHYCEECKKKLE